MARNTENVLRGQQQMESLLFTPLALRGLRLRNRIVVSPMLTYAATNGCATTGTMCTTASSRPAAPG
jgi:2,4-dienoyl-CoA reductase-like NADH-dependent reductase (Old Yellow Enzyme family)